MKVLKFSFLSLVVLTSFFSHSTSQTCTQTSSTPILIQFSDEIQNLENLCPSIDENISVSPNYHGIFNISSIPVRSDIIQGGSDGNVTGFIIKNLNESSSISLKGKLETVELPSLRRAGQIYFETIARERRAFDGLGELKNASDVVIKGFESVELPKLEYARNIEIALHGNTSLEWPSLIRAASITITGNLTMFEIPEVRYLPRVNINSNSIFDCEHFRRNTWRLITIRMELANITDTFRDFECVSNMWGENPYVNPVESHGGLGKSNSARRSVIGSIFALGIGFGMGLL